MSGLVYDRWDIAALELTLLWLVMFGIGLAIARVRAARQARRGNRYYRRSYGSVLPDPSPTCARAPRQHMHTEAQP